MYLLCRLRNYAIESSNNEAREGYGQDDGDGEFIYSLSSTYRDIFHPFISPAEFLHPQSAIAAVEQKAAEAEEFVSNLSEDKERYQILMKNVVKLTKPETWPYLASCLYEAFRETQDSSSLSQAITELVSEDDFQKFNHYFQRYVGSIAMALETVLESEDSIEMVQLTYQLTKSEIKSISYNHLHSMAYFVVQLKTVLNKPDIKELHTSLNQTDYFIQESLWKFNTGRWPEMETFVKNFHRKTVGNEKFWNRLTQQFIPVMVKEKIPEMIHWLMDQLRTLLRENDFYYLADINIEDVADTIFEKLTSITAMIADGDKASIRQLFKDIRGSKWDETIISYIEIIGDHLTRFVIFLLQLSSFPMLVI